MRNEKHMDAATAGRLLAVLLLTMLLFSALLPALNGRAYAADGKISLKVGRVIDYSSHFTNYFYAGDKDCPVYCSQPQMPGPASGTYDYSFLKPDSTLAKCLYYGYGGPGFDEYTDRQLSGHWDGADDAYCLTHIVISIAYDKTMDGETDPFRGLSGTWKAKAKDLYDYVKGLPDPPPNYRAYIISNPGKQDILGSFNDTGSIRIEKSSAGPAKTKDNSAYSLAGARYGVFWGEELICTITTDGNGRGEAQNILAGDYTIRELEPSQGYAIDVKSHGCSVKDETTATVDVKEQPKAAPVEIVLQKGDAETGKAQPQGGAHLEGAVYEIRFFHKGSESAERTWRVVTGSDGIARLTKEGLDASFENSPFYETSAGVPCFPLGTVTIKEVKAPEGYLLNDKVYRTEITGTEGTSETDAAFNVPAIGSAAAMAEQPKRGDLKLVKVKDGTMARLPGVQFRITSKTTGESHLVCTDENGMIDTSASFNPHGQDTNGGTADSGLWFGESPAEESRCALLYDRYVLDEVAGPANAGMTLAEGVEIRIYRDSAVLDLGTVTDDVMKMGTTAADSETKDHIALADGKVTIIDRVAFEGLQPGRDYRMEGTLMDRTTGSPVMNGDKPVTGETEFSCEDTKGTVEVRFTFDASALGGTDVVVFERCFDIETGTLLLTHEDIEDTDQRVSLPKIGTKALGPDGKTNVIKAEKDQKITDTVAYEGLLPGREYELVTWLTKDGRKVRGTKTVRKFTPQSAKGEVRAELTFDGTKFGGKTLTVFEEVRMDGKVVGEHKDRTDKEQMIRVEKAQKPAPGHSPKTGDGMAPGAWIAAALGALFAAGGLLYEERKRRRM